MAEGTPPERGLNLRTLAVVGTLQFLGKMRGLILVPVMLRVFGAADYGVWIQSILLVSLFAGIAQGSLHTTLLRYLPASLPERRAAIVWNGLQWVVGASLATAALVVTVGHPLIARFAPLPRSLLLGVGALVVLRSLGQFLANIPRADGHGRRYALLDLVPLLAELLAVVLAAALGGRLGTAMACIVVIESVYVAGLLVVSLRRLRWVRPTRVELEPLLRYALPGIPVSVSGFLLSFADRYVIGGILDVAAVGLYSAAYALASLPTSLARPLGVQLLPSAAAAWNVGDRTTAVRLLRDSTRLYAGIGIPVVVGAVAVGPAVLSRMAGATHAEWSPALFLSIGLGTWLYGLLGLMLHGYHLQERVGATAAYFLAAAGLNVALNVVLLPRLGILGAGIATALAYGAVAIPVAVSLRRGVGSVVDWGGVGRASAASVVMGTVVRLCPQSTVAGLASAIALGVATYAALALPLGVVTKAEAAAAVAALRKRVVRS